MLLLGNKVIHTCDYSQICKKKYIYKMSLSPPSCADQFIILLFCLLISQSQWTYLNVRRQFMGINWKIHRFINSGN